MDEAKARERVLVIPSARFEDAGIFHGFRPFSESYLRTLLDPGSLSFRPRGEVETDPSFKQLIPYVLLRCRGSIFHYRRGSSGTEKRLQALRSIGVGGHISVEDESPGSDLYRAGMLRELNEEMRIDSLYTEHCLGFIYDAATPVGEVHLGVVHLLELDEPRAWPREEAIDEAGFATLEQLQTQRVEFETWSQFALAELSNGVSVGFR
jgi:predicted NUDIX family phosphoesterase